MREQLIGKTLDRYRIIAFLGEGGMGAVLKARDITLKRDVAIKIMHPQFAQQPDFRQRFLQEAQSAAQLSHPNIVKVYDFRPDSAHSLLYIVMEFLDGDNLRGLLRGLKAQEKWIPLSEAVELVRQVSLALDYAHGKGVLHRDIKPANIMLKPEPSGELPLQPVVTDLGLAQLAGGLVTQGGSSMGTPAYMSPEQASGEKTDARSDVYSLGILLYELAVGQVPFPVETLSEAGRFHTQEPPPPPRELRPNLPQHLEGIILKALEKDPADRYPDAGALAEALAGALSDATQIDSPPPDFKAADSLKKQYQKSLATTERIPAPPDFPEPLPDLGQDRILVAAQGQAPWPVSLTSKGLTIGRALDNDLVLDSPNVSPQHARIEMRGTDYQVTDLESKTGTFLGEAKLLPGISETWKPDDLLRIGDHYLRLQRAGLATPRPSILREDGTAVEADLIHSSPAGVVDVVVEPLSLVVDPGESSALTVTILNRSPVVDHFEVSVAGKPAEWLAARPAAAKLRPGEQQQVPLTFRPPRSPQSQAGDYALPIRVSSRADPDQVVEVETALTVTPYVQYQAELSPQEIRAGNKATATVENQGNVEQTFSLAWSDRADELSFKPSQAELEVAAGQAAPAEFRARLRRRRWFGGEQRHHFQVKVSAPDSPAQTVDGTLVSRASIPLTLGWVMLLIACLGLLASLGIIELGNGRKPVTQATATPKPTATHTLGPPPEIETMEGIYNAIKIEGLSSDKLSYSAGETAIFQFNLVNRSDSRLIVPVDDRRGGPAIGIRQHWVRRLGADSDIPIMSEDWRRRDGARYATHPTPILIHADEMDSSESLSFGPSLWGPSLDTFGYPPGTYRYYVEYQTLDYVVLQTETVEFEIRQGLLYTEDFSSNKPVWRVGAETDEFGEGTAEIIDGKYRRSFVAEKSIFSRSFVPVRTKDFLLSVEATVVEASSPGAIAITFRGTITDDYYAVKFYSDGSYRVLLRQDKEWEDIQSRTPSDAFSLDPGLTNEFGVSVEDSSFTIYANGQELTTLSDTTLSEAGNIALVLSLDAGQTLTVDFDNLVIEDTQAAADASP